MNWFRRSLVALSLAAAAVVGSSPTSAATTVSVVKADHRGTAVDVTITLDCAYTSGFSLGVEVRQERGPQLVRGSFLSFATCSPSPSTFTVRVDALGTGSAADRFHNGRAHVLVADAHMGGSIPLFSGDVRITNR